MADLSIYASSVATNVSELCGIVIQSVSDAMSAIEGAAVAVRDRFAAPGMGIESVCETDDLQRVNESLAGGYVLLAVQAHREARAIYILGVKR